MALLNRFGLALVLRLKPPSRFDKATAARAEHRDQVGFVAPIDSLLRLLLRRMRRLVDHLRDEMHRQASLGQRLLHHEPDRSNRGQA